MSEPIGYIFEPQDFRTLQTICNRLFGDGTHLTADQRRDLANLMQVTLGRAQPHLATTAKTT